MTENDFLLLQINDALFPIGAYSHSYGLETYIQNHTIANAKEAEKYLYAKLNYNILYSDLFAVRLCFEYTKEHNIDQLCEMNQLVEVTKAPYEIRDASIKMGSRFLKTINSLNLDFDTSLLDEFVSKVGAKKVHHVCLYGILCALADIKEEIALSHYLYSQTSSMVTTCVKTIPLSQTDGQIILTSSFSLLTKLVTLVMELSMDMFGISTPGFDICSMQHENIYSRIYMS